MVCTLSSLASFTPNNYFDIYPYYCMSITVMPFFFLLLNKVPSCKHIKICLFIDLLMDIWIVSSF